MQFLKAKKRHSANSLRTNLFLLLKKGVIPKIVSFDVFDTLILRRCHPDAVLSGAASYLREKVQGMGISLQVDPLQAYHRAYRELAITNQSNGLDCEVFTKDLFPAWIAEINPRFDRGEHQNTLARLLKEEILRLELSVCYANEELREILATLRDYGVKLIYTSDMFLGSEIVDEILKACELRHFFADGIVSSDVALLKRSGKLFRYLLNQHECTPNEFWHIGDNPHSDGVEAKRAGIRAFVYYNRRNVKEQTSRLLDWETAFSLPTYSGRLIAGFATPSRVEEASSGLTDIEAYGRLVLGPIYTTFVHQTLERCAREGVTDIFFLAREGFTLYKLAEELAPLYEGRSKFRFEYLCISRYVAFMAGVEKFGLREIAVGAANLPPSIANLLSPFKFTALELQQLVSRYGILDPYAVLPPFYLSWPPFMRLSEDKWLNDRIDALRSEHLPHFIKYLDQIKFLGRSKVALVDVGWAGQIQESIYKVIKHRRDAPAIIGYYMGMTLGGHWRKEPQNWMEWIYGDQDHSDWCSLPLFQYPQGFEAVPRAPHGTTLGFTEVKSGEKGRIIPVFRQEDSPARGQERADDPKLSLMQRGIFHYAKLHVAACRLYHLKADWLVPYARDLIERMIRYPKAREASWLLGINNISDLGSDVNYVMGEVIKPKFFVRRKRVNHALAHSFWHHGTLSFFGGFWRQGVRAITEDIKQNKFNYESYAPGALFHGSNLGTKREVESVVSQSKPLMEDITLISTKIQEETLRNRPKASESGKVSIGEFAPLTFWSLLPSYFIFLIAKYRSAKYGRRRLYRAGIPISVYFARAMKDLPLGRKLLSKTLQILRYIPWVRKAVSRKSAALNRILILRDA
jgi:FMN phosphatase YigB (HAD superfamily)